MDETPVKNQENPRHDLSAENLSQQRKGVIFAVVAVIFILAVIITSLIFLFHPRTDAEYVARMEDVLDQYEQPYDPKRPLVCYDEGLKQLIEETRQGVPAKP